jgi:hypothetical protein
MRTFTRSALDEARAAWDAGDFSDEWKPFRHKAVMGGLIYPPSGTKWDSWDDDAPSQRAMLIRAIRETPRLLERCVIGAPSWSVVIDRLTHARDDWRAELDAKARDEDRRMAEDAVPHREAVTSLAAILTRIEGAR